MKLFLLLLLSFSFFSEATSYAHITFPKANSLSEAVYFGDIEEVKDLIKRVIVNDLEGTRSVTANAMYGSVPFFDMSPSEQASMRAWLKKTAVIDKIKKIPSHWWDNTMIMT